MAPDLSRRLATSGTDGTIDRVHGSALAVDAGPPPIIIAARAESGGGMMGFFSSKRFGIVGSDPAVRDSEPREHRVTVTNTTHPSISPMALNGVFAASADRHPAFRPRSYRQQARSSVRSQRVTAARREAIKERAGRGPYFPLITCSFDKAARKMAFSAMKVAMRAWPARFG